MIIALGLPADRALTDAPEGHTEVHLIGDCAEPREALDAVYEGVEGGADAVE